MKLSKSQILLIGSIIKFAHTSLKINIEHLENAKNSIENTDRIASLREKFDDCT